MKGRIRKLVVALVSMATLVVSLTFQGPAMAMATDSPFLTPIPLGTMSNKVNAKAKETEGKLESAYGSLTGDAGRKVKGEAKQAQAGAMNAAEAVKGGAKSLARGASDAADTLADKIK